jgi:hypothetical protein
MRFPPRENEMGLLHCIADRAQTGGKIVKG